MASCPVFEVIVETPSYRIYWQDEQRTICGIRVLAKQWTWHEALECIQKVDEAVKSVAHGVYVIYSFEPGTNIMPRGSNLIAHLRPLINIYTPNTILILFVRPDPSLRIFTTMVLRVFQFTGRNYMFVNSMAEAQHVITDHRQPEKSN